MIWNPVTHAIPSWELERGGGPVTDILRRREKDKGRKGSLALQVCSTPRFPHVDLRSGVMGDGNRWVSAATIW